LVQLFYFGTPFTSLIQQGFSITLILINGSITNLGIGEFLILVALDELAKN
jgi:hypothetical protein